MGERWRRGTKKRLKRGRKRDEKREEKGELRKGRLRE